MVHSDFRDVHFTTLSLSFIVCECLYNECLSPRAVMKIQGDEVC